MLRKRSTPRRSNASDDKKHAEAEESERRPLPSEVKAAQRAVKRVILGTVVPVPECEFYNLEAESNCSSDDDTHKQSGVVTKGGIPLLVLSPEIQANVESFSTNHRLDEKCVERLVESGDRIASQICNQSLRAGIRNPSAYISKAIRNAEQEQVATEELEHEPEAEQEQVATEELEHEPEATPEQEAYLEGYAEGYAEGVEVWAEPEAEEEQVAEEEQEEGQADDEHEYWDSPDDWW